MGVIKATMFMQLGRWAWTESHWTNQFADLPGAIPEAIKLAKSRSGCFGTQTTMMGLRLSSEGVFRDSKIVEPDLLPTPPGQLAINVNNADLNSDVEDVAVILRAESGVLHRKSIFLRGGVDAAVGNAFQPREIDKNNPFFGQVAKYTNYLVNNGWGFYGRDDAPPKVAVVGIVADGAPPAHFGPQVAAGTGGYAVGDFVQLSGFSVAKGKPKVNGIYQVAGPIPAAAGGLQSYFLNNSIGIDPTGLTKMGTVQKVAKTFLPYTDIILRYVKRRATGGRTALPLGRRKIRR